MNKLIMATEISGNTIVAIDYGLKKVGLARYQVGLDPFPTRIGIIYYKKKQELWQKLENVVLEEAPEILVLGLPTYEDGNDSSITKKVRSFHEDLKAKFPTKKIYLQNENFSTYDAKEQLNQGPKSKKHKPQDLDDNSARLILEKFIQEKISF